MEEQATIEAINTAATVEGVLTFQVDGRSKAVDDAIKARLAELEGISHIIDSDKAATVVATSLAAADEADAAEADADKVDVADVADEVVRIIKAITLGQDCTYFIRTAHGADVTRQWYNGQTITNPADITEVMRHHPVIKDIIYAD